MKSVEVRPAPKSSLRDGLDCARLPHRVVVDISEVRIIETDFQEEGLPVAMCRWLEHVFDLPPRKIGESFDKAANKYRFDWDNA